MDDASKPPDGGTDAEIVERVQRGDVQAYGALVDRYERTLLAAVLPVIRDAHAARDVVQDVFVLCFVKLRSLRDGSRFGGWLLKAGGREAVRAARRRRRVTLQLTQPLDEEPAVPPGTAWSLYDDDERARLLDCVRRLPAHERIAISLRYFEGRGVHEIARIVGRPVGTVTKQLSRAVERLRGELQPTRTTTTNIEAIPCQQTPTSRTS